MSDSENKQLLNQKLIKIKPIRSIQHAIEDDPVDTNNEIETVQHEIEQMQQELQHLAQQKEALLEQTNLAIEEAKKDWEETKQQLIDSAKQEGYQAGFLQGEHAGKAAYEEKLNQANLIIDATTIDYHATIEKSEETILQLALSIAEKIIGEEVSENPEAFLGIIRQAIQELKDQSTVTIYLHPSNYEYVIGQKDELMRILEDDSTLAIYLDEKLKENTCLIEHSFGQIDASVDTQLSKIREALQDYLMEKRQ
ncbi:flagellar assembly protein FliH [Oceanobacillus polygoni]|uniref:Flagellar assembly protein FliH n=1 Tax=Oceanobacillus polygoni TaxID=1235259 RepID=A0A9X0YVB7_9BACI|nr:flagellar assembly protein FliH [Oceanobacillus polygoni]MBP2077656.1 flagellar assembly protein FliH [Oceanobacillus polygoni]